MATYTIRRARPGDAPQTRAHLMRLAQEPESGVLFGPDDVPPTLEEERKLIADYANAPNSIYLVAEVEGLIIGNCTGRGGRRLASGGSVGVGIAVHADWRGKGVGTALLRNLIGWAQRTGAIWRIELDVFTHNAQAIHVYQKLGFEIEGRRQKAYYKNGQFVDAFMMALLLES
ncbi:MAG: GNAT family N-acetyltransferase [Chloroflexota bacterium]